MRKIIDETNAVFQKVAAQVASFIEAKPDAVIGITEVDVPEAFFAALRNCGVSFSDVTFFNACELAGDAGSGAQSQAAKLQTLLYDAVHPKSVRVPEGETYDDDIRAAGGMDLVILGIGERGHVAYDEPGVDFGAPTHENKLADVTRNALAEAFGGLENTPTHGVTMGIATILSAKHILLLASGEDKANAVQKTLEGRPETFIPASFLQLHTDVTVYLDQGAASKLG